MPQLTPQADKANALVKYLEDRKSDLAAALPGHLGIDRMFRVWLTEFRRTPKLLNCAPASIYGALLTSAQLGLEIGVLNNAWLIPFGQECQLLIGYEGLLDLIDRSGKVSAVWAEVVYEGDEWEVRGGTEPGIVHKSKRPDKAHTDDEVIGFYAVAQKAAGVKVHVWMWKWEVDRIRSRARSGDKGPWVTDYVAMGKKTAIRQLCKLLPKSPELAKALDLDTKTEMGLGLLTGGAAMEADFEVVPEPAAAPAADGNGGAPSPEIALRAELNDLAAQAKYGLVEISQLLHECGNDLSEAVSRLKVLVMERAEGVEQAPATPTAAPASQTKPAPRATAARQAF